MLKCLSVTLVQVSIEDHNIHYFGSGLSIKLSDLMAIKSMSQRVQFGIRFVPVVAMDTSYVWDDADASDWIHQFMPHDRTSDPTLGILDIGKLRPTPHVLNDVVVVVGEDIKAGRYGALTFFICSEDEHTREIIRDVASSRNIALFLSSSSRDLGNAEPGGALSLTDSETLGVVKAMGGTVTAVEFASGVGIKENAAGNRLASLHRKGYLQRKARPHPTGDLFIDSRTVQLGSTNSDRSHRK